MFKKSNILIKTKEEIKTLQDAGKILSAIVTELKSSLKVGMTTKDIDDLAGNLVAKYRVIAAFKGYRGFPAHACISINDEVVHGIPGTRKIRENDLVSIDMGIIYQGFFSDMAVTVGVGSVDPIRQKLLDVTKQSLLKGIVEARVGNRLGDLSYAIQRYVESKGFSIVRDFVGHGIGRSLHEDPEIPNYGIPKTGVLLKAGMVFAIEPMVNMGRPGTKILEDGWTAVTIDGKPSAHFEHSVAITESGPIILTE